MASKVRVFFSIRLGVNTSMSATGDVILALLVPAFQHERYLSELLDSICRQTRKPDEILISDDASADGSYEVLKGWARGRPGVKIFRQPQNLGITGNSNFLLSKTKSDLVLFLHSDDTLLSSRALEKMELLFRCESKLALVATGEEHSFQ
jgi:glycosyltransferase involved in cell wall biosynthesis